MAEAPRQWFPFVLGAVAGALIAAPASVAIYREWTSAWGVLHRDVERGHFLGLTEALESTRIKLGSPPPDFYPYHTTTLTDDQGCRWITRAYTEQTYLVLLYIKACETDPDGVVIGAENYDWASGKHIWAMRDNEQMPRLEALAIDQSKAP